MSRCFPFPPPGFENKIQYNENYLSPKEKKKEKKNRKEKNNKKEGKEKKRKDKKKSKPKQKGKKYKGSDTNTEGVEGNDYFSGVQGMEVESRDTEFLNGFIVAENHNRGNRSSWEVYQNPRDSSIIPAGVHGSNQYYNSGDKSGMNSLHPISNNASRFVKESTKNVRVVNRSGGRQQPNVRNGFRNGGHLGPNHLHFSMKSGHENLGEPVWSDQCTNSSGGESARSYGYCNGDGPIHNHDHFVGNKNQRHMHELDMKRRPLTKPVTVIMDRRLSSAVTEIDPPFRGGRREQPVYRTEETRSIFIGQKNNVQKSSLMGPFHSEMSDRPRGAEICQNHEKNDIAKPGEDGRAKLDGSSIPKEGGMREGGKRKREDEKHMIKEEKGMRKQEKCKRKEEAKTKKREEKAKKREIGKSKAVNQSENMQSSAEHDGGNDGAPDCTSRPSQPPLPMELDSFHIVQIPRRPENLSPAHVLNATPVPSSTIPARAEETKRSSQDSRPTVAADCPHSGTMEDDSDTVCAQNATHADMDRLLYQFPPLPEMEHIFPPTDEQDWLFNDSGGFRSSGRNQSPPIEVVEVWAETLRIESADVFALPYVIPY